MESRISNLPPEIESLHKIIASLHGKNRELVEQNNNWSTKYQILSNQNTELLERINSLEEQLKLLKAKRFGKSSEKLEYKIDRV